MNRIKDIEDQIAGLQNGLDVVQKLLSAFAAEKLKDKKKVDLSDQYELVDNARKVCPDHLPEGVYEWKTEDQISLVEKKLESACSNITTQISLKMMYLTDALQGLPETARIGSQTIATLREEGHHIVGNQTK